jgi:geranylgeranylglycerol-phosphate geranylgeranyltransferase
MNFKDIVELIIPQYVPLAIAGALVGTIITIQKIPDYKFILLSISLFFVVGAFNTYNALADKEIDKINKPERPLASNKINDKEAKILTVIFYSLAFLFSIFINLQTIAIILFAIIITYLYSKKPIYLKKRLIIGNLTGAMFYAVLCPLAGWSIYQNNPINFTIFFFLFILGIGLSFVKDFEDSVGDGIHHINSLPVVIGKTQTTNLIMLIEIFAFSIIAYGIFAEILSIDYLILLFLVIPFLFYTLKFKKIKNLVYDRQIFNKIVFLIILSEFVIILLTFV